MQTRSGSLMINAKGELSFLCDDDHYDFTLARAETVELARSMLLEPIDPPPPLFGEKR